MLPSGRERHGVVVSGPIETFIERTKGLFAARKPEEHRKHWLGNMRAEIKGNRAVLETDVQIMIREYIGDSLYDCTSYARFYDLMEKRDGAWRIGEWQTIYDKDGSTPWCRRRTRAVLCSGCVQGR